MGRPGLLQLILPALMLIAGCLIAWFVSPLGLIVAAIGLYRFGLKWLPGKAQLIAGRVENWLAVLVITVFLARSWQPLGIERGELVNFIFVGALIGSTLASLQIFQFYYPTMLGWCLRYKKTIPRGAEIAVSVVVLIGGFMLRYVVVIAGQITGPVGV